MKMLETIHFCYAKFDTFPHYIRQMKMRYHNLQIYELCQISSRRCPVEQFSSIFHDYLHIFFSHVPHVYSILWSFIFWDKGWRKLIILIIIIKAFPPLKVEGNYAVKQNYIVHGSPISFRILPGCIE